MVNATRNPRAERLAMPATLDGMLEGLECWPTAARDASNRCDKVMRGLPLGLQDAIGGHALEELMVKEDFMFAVGVGVGEARAAGRDVDAAEVAAEILHDALAVVADREAKGALRRANQNMSKLIDGVPSRDVVLEAARRTADGHQEVTA